MAIVVESVGVSPGANTTTCVIVKPTGVAVGDLLIASMTYAQNSTPTISPPAGWSLIRKTSSVVDGSPTVHSFYKIATATEVSASDFTFTSSGSASNKGAMLRISGAVFGAYDTEAEATSSIITISPGSMSGHALYVLCGGSDAPDTWTNAAGLTEQTDSNTTAGNDTSLYMGTGASPTFTDLTRSSSTDGSVAHGFFIDAGATTTVKHLALLGVG